MGRPLRIEFASAIYHVTSRGNARQAIFSDDDDRRLFLWILQRVTERCGWLIHAYCLMGNHYHILAETSRPNLSAGMRTLNGRYTCAFNRRRGRSGHLFQGRFSSVLVEKEPHLLELCRYVVLNPVRAKSMKIRRPEDWPWSSYRATSGMERPHACLHTEWVLSQFSRVRRLAHESYTAFVRSGIAMRSPLLEARGGFLLGSESFTEKVVGLLDKGALSPEHPRLQRHAARPPLERILSPELCNDREARDRAVAEAFLTHGHTQKAIADHLGVHYSTICRILLKTEQ